MKIKREILLSIRSRVYIQSVIGSVVLALFTRWKPCVASHSHLNARLGENTNEQIGIDDRSRAAVCKHNVIGGYGVSRPRYLFVSDLLSLCFSLRLRILGTHGMGAACFSSLGFRHRSRPSSHRRRRLVASRRER